MLFSPIRFTTKLSTLCRVALLITAAGMSLGNATVAEAFIAASRWSDTALQDVGPRGTPVTLSWSLVPDGTEIRGGGTSDLLRMLDDQFEVVDRTSPLSSRPWMSLFDAAFRRWSEVGGVRFEYEPFDDGAVHRQSPGEQFVRGDIRLAAKSVDGIRGVLASSQFPDGGDITIDSDGPGYLLDPAYNYRRFRNTLMHEIGHTLGLEHIVSSDAQLLMEPELSQDYDGPQLDDIRGLHYLYGDRYEWNANNTWQTATPLGPVVPDTPLLIGGDAGLEQAVGPDSSDFLSISSRSDLDFYRFTIDHPGFLDVELTPAGGQFRQAALGDVQLLTNTTASSNLSLALLDPLGNLIFEVDETLHGGIETLDHVRLDTIGDYVLRVRGTRDTVQLYSLSVAHQYGNPIPEPSSALLLLLSCLILVRMRCSAVLMVLLNRPNVRG